MAAARISNSEMLRESTRPLFLLLWLCMWMTAATELGPDQWVGSLITQLTGMQGVLILVYTAGLMFVLRFFGGGVAHKLSPFAILGVSAVLSAAGLFLLGSVEARNRRLHRSHGLWCWQDLLLADDARRNQRIVPQRSERSY